MWFVDTAEIMHIDLAHTSSWIMYHFVFLLPYWFRLIITSHQSTSGGEVRVMLIDGLYFETTLV